jgi:hypothetical protein
LDEDVVGEVGLAAEEGLTVGVQGKVHGEPQALFNCKHGSLCET